MAQQVLTRPIDALADAVLADPRWVRDDLNVSILGMILYGFALATARGLGLAVADVDAALLHCLTERIGAAARWSGGFVAEANASASDEDHHVGHTELIALGQTYHGVAQQSLLVNNVFANFQSVRERSGLPPLPEPLVSVFLNPLVLLLAARERQKGAPLTEAEVLEVRDTTLCTRMPYSQAEQFYAALDAQSPVPRLDPERLWQEWQAVREHVIAAEEAG